MRSADMDIDIKQNEMKVQGALIQGYALACLNLNVIAGTKISKYTESINVSEWYPLDDWVNLEKTVIQSYKNAKAILVRVGIEMMKAWYNFGPGKNLIKNGVGFLHFQTGSEGYVSVVKGPRTKVGVFELESLDEKKGLAVVKSTTPFNKKMECGVLIGGMSAPGDLDYVDAVNYDNPNYIEIEFH
jgi:hypothetical protein